MPSSSTASRRSSSTWRSPPRASRRPARRSPGAAWRWPRCPGPTTWRIPIARSGTREPVGSPSSSPPRPISARAWSRSAPARATPTTCGARIPATRRRRPGGTASSRSRARSPSRSGTASCSRSSRSTTTSSWTRPPAGGCSTSCGPRTCRSSSTPRTSSAPASSTARPRRCGRRSRSSATHLCSRTRRTCWTTARWWRPAVAAWTTRCTCSCCASPATTGRSCCTGWTRTRSIGRRASSASGSACARA
jgi:hypothetical protein